MKKQLLFKLNAFLLIIWLFFTGAMNVSAQTDLISGYSDLRIAYQQLKRACILDSLQHDGSTANEDTTVFQFRMGVSTPGFILFIVAFALSSTYCKVSVAQIETEDFMKSLEEFMKITNTKDDSKQDTTQIIRVARLGDFHLVTYLLHNGADVNVSDDLGTTPLIVASEAGKFDVARLLLKHGANVYAKDKLGETAIVKSIINGHVNTAALLAAFMSKAELSELNKFSRRIANPPIDKILTGFQKSDSPLINLLKGSWMYDTRDLHALFLRVLGEEQYEAHKDLIDTQKNRLAHEFGKSRFEIVPGAGSIFVLVTIEGGSPSVDTFIIKTEKLSEAIVENVVTGEQLRIVSTTASTMSISSSISDTGLLLIRVENESQK